MLVLFIWEGVLFVSFFGFLFLRGGGGVGEVSIGTDVCLRAIKQI